MTGPRRGFVFEIIKGKGAGYIGGATFWIALRSRDRRNIHAYVGRQRSFLQWGFTRNGNRTPIPGWWS